MMNSPGPCATDYIGSVVLAVTPDGNTYAGVLEWICIGGSSYTFPLPLTLHLVGMKKALIIEDSSKMTFLREV